jgi:probable rRNA maturation factor
MIDAETDKPPPPGSRGESAIDVIDSTRALPAEAVVWLRTRAARAMEALRAFGEVRVRVVADPEMAAAHQRWKGLPGPTDVLTFDLSDGLNRGEELDVDILVCLDEARRHGVERGHTPERELLLYIVHGLLHCLGHDDHEESAAAAMHAMEDRVLEALGVGATFAPGSRQEAVADRGNGREQD